MNNKGFGIGIIFIFIILTFAAILSFYFFVKNVINPILYTYEVSPNYKNEYRIYMKEHNISLNK